MHYTTENYVLVGNDGYVTKLAVNPSPPAPEQGWFSYLLGYQAPQRENNKTWGSLTFRKTTRPE